MFLDIEKCFKLNPTFHSSNIFKERFRRHPAEKGRPFYWNSFVKKKMVTTDELAKIPSLTREFQRQNQNLSWIFARNRWFVRVPCLYLIILVNPVVLYLRLENQIHIMIFYVEFNWDSQALSNEKNTCLYRSLLPVRINHYHIYRIIVFLFIQQFVLIRHLTPEKIYRFILEINLSDCPFMTECWR